ncbi:Hypothetical_protein [Hexamita inflata]|uniref:Hypothetical_protein n=1 Tax=Hexamita inflata TaxID=28002 RepID=A0AA86QWF6_9EUKA|nr:Hypothetical protein HINF_LOCUS14324 [Hexamita inflata]CAI9960664.1 Hypothetical protein HINF_LOCUS48309 [Hexamita inflata]
MESRKFVQIRPVSLGPVIQSSPKLIQIREDSEPEITELIIKKENNKHEKVDKTINSEPPVEKEQIEAEIQILPVEINKVEENVQQPVVIKVRRRTIEEQKNEEPKIKNAEARALVEQFEKQLHIENALNQNRNQNNIQEQKIENIIIDQVEVKTEIKTEEKPKELTAKQDKINKKELEKKLKEDLKKQKELEKQQKELEKKQKEQEKIDKKNKNSKEAPKIETQEQKKEEVIQNTVQSQIEPTKINQQEQANNEQQELLTLAEQISKQNTLKFIQNIINTQKQESFINTKLDSVYKDDIVDCQQTSQLASFSIVEYSNQLEKDYVIDIIPNLTTELQFQIYHQLTNSYFASTASLQVTKTELSYRLTIKFNQMDSGKLIWLQISSDSVKSQYIQLTYQAIPYQMSQLQYVARWINPDQGSSTQANLIFKGQKLLIRAQNQQIELDSVSSFCYSEIQALQNSLQVDQSMNNSLVQINFGDQLPNAPNIAFVSYFGFCFAFSFDSAEQMQNFILYSQKLSGSLFFNSYIDETHKQFLQNVTKFDTKLNRQQKITQNKNTLTEKCTIQFTFNQNSLTTNLKSKNLPLRPVFLVYFQNRIVQKLILQKQTRNRWGNCEFQVVSGSFLSQKEQNASFMKKKVVGKWAQIYWQFKWVKGAVVVFDNQMAVIWDQTVHLENIETILEDVYVIVRGKIVIGGSQRILVKFNNESDAETVSQQIHV